jgi:hypothetical protein
VSLSCSPTSGTPTGALNAGNPQQADITVAAGDAITCTWTNEKEATLTIEKDVVDGPEDTTFSFSQTGGITDVGSPFTLEESGAISLGPVVVTPDVYRFVEELPASWMLSGLSCTGTTTTRSEPAGEMSISIEAGQVVVCTLENTKVPTLVIEKATALPDEFFFAVDEPDLVTNAEGFPILGSTGVLDGVLGGGGSFGVAVANSVPVEIVELALTGAAPKISCTNLDGDDLFAQGRAALTRDGAGVEVTPENSEDITCVFDNDVGSLTIAKQTAPAGSPTVFGFGASGHATTAFSLADEQVVVLAGIADGTTLTVNESPLFGFELSSIECTGPRRARSSRPQRRAA